jgi:hypothetical protein
MTDKEIIEAVATEVMGYTEDEWTHTGSAHPTALVFNPLTNANHWMMVACKLDMAFEIRRQPGSWLVIFNGLIIKEHSSIGHAVCLAALKANEK